MNEDGYNSSTGSLSGDDMKRQLALVCLAFLCSACLRATTTITVRQDGSGLIDQEVGASPQAMAMLKQFAGAAAEQEKGAAAPAPQSIFGEAEAKKMADQMGVKFLSGEPIKTAELEGYRAHYGFDDVTKLKVKMNQNTTAGLTESKSTAEPPFSFQFEKRGASSLLTINMPEQKPGASTPLNQLGIGGGGSQNAAQNEQALAMMKTMMKGLYVDVTLAVDGKVIKTNAPYVNGSRVTLVQMDFDKLLATEGALQKLQQANDPRTLKDVPGLKVVADPKLMIEFGR
jgi:hypothetical protein